MARVIADLIDGEVRYSAQGNSVRRLFQVSELSGAASNRLAQAARASGIPQVGQAHPSVPGIVVQDVRASATSDPTVATVDVSYGVPSTTTSAIGGRGIEISIVADLYTEETIIDVNGNRIETTYFGTSASGGGSFSTSVTRQAHRIEVQRPTFSVQFSRLESAPPLDLARFYSGRVNNGAFLNEPADRWLCNVESSQESDRVHRVRYTFTLNTIGWQAQITHSTNGIIPTDLSSANGIRTAQVYHRANFGALRLPSI